MNLKKTPIEGLIIIEPSIFKDDRGYFFESYNHNRYVKSGIENNFVQDNQSFSEYGTIRGLHLQTGSHAQAKLVRVIKGIVLDVAVDLREGSKTYGEYFSIELSEDNNTQFYIPRGFAHGFSVLSETAIFSYKCDNFYNKESESGIIYNDTDINIDWGIPHQKAKVSEKDLILPSFKKFQDRIK